MSPFPTVETEVVLLSELPISSITVTGREVP